MRDQAFKLFLSNIPRSHKLENLFSLKNFEKINIPDSTLEELKNVFYSFIKSEPEYLKMFENSSSIVQIAKKFRPFIQGIFSLPIDEAYIERCFNVGYAHFLIKLEPYGFTLGLWKIAEYIKENSPLPKYTDNVIHLVNFLVNSALSSCKQYEDSRNAQQHKILLRSILHDLSGPLNALEFRYENLQREFELFESSLDFSFNLLDSAKNAVIALDQKGEFPDSKSDSLNLHRLVEQLLELSLVKAVEKNIHIKFERNNIELIEIKTNSYKLSQAISNLLSNAIKFTEKDGEVRIGFEKVGENLKFSIADSGIGIVREKFAKIYEIELCGSTRGTGGEKGSGYGLPIAKNFLDSLGYELSIESSAREEAPDKKHGTKCSIIIPSNDIVSLS